MIYDNISGDTDLPLNHLWVDIDGRTYREYTHDYYLVYNPHRNSFRARHKDGFRYSIRSHREISSMEYIALVQYLTKENTKVAKTLLNQIEVIPDRV